MLLQRLQRACGCSALVPKGTIDSRLNNRVQLRRKSGECFVDSALHCGAGRRGLLVAHVRQATIIVVTLVTLMVHSLLFIL